MDQAKASSVCFGCTEIKDRFFGLRGLWVGLYGCGGGLGGREGQHGLGRDRGRCFRDGQPGTSTTLLLTQKKQLVLVLKHKNFPTELRKQTFAPRYKTREGFLL